MKIISCFIFLFLQITNMYVWGQLTIPYINSFDVIDDSIGWSHYAISGIDDWALGPADNGNAVYNQSYPNIWATNLNGLSNTTGNRALQTPSFDFTNLPSTYVFNFYHRRIVNWGTMDCFVEYSTDAGFSWSLLDIEDDLLKLSWQESDGFPNSTPFSFVRSSISIGFLQGQSDVRFRFRCISSSATGDGWQIDDFSIKDEYNNLSATSAQATATSQNCPSITVTSTLQYYRQYSGSASIVAYYYLSTDSILDEMDIFIGQKQANWSMNNTWSHTVSLPEDQPAGDYFVLYDYDVLNSVVENIENDNTSYSRLTLLPTYPTPFNDDFENESILWKTYVGNNSDPRIIWMKGIGTRHQFDGTHSGVNSYHIGYSPEMLTDEYYGIGSHYLESPSIDLTDAEENVVINFWYKSRVQNVIFVNDGCDNVWIQHDYIPECRNDDWDFINISIDNLVEYNNVRFRIRGYYDQINDIESGFIIDDVYIGIERPDLSIEGDKENYYTSITSSNLNLKYHLRNCGIDALATQSEFYWSTDSILDGNDIFLGQKNEIALGDTASTWTDFVFEKPTLTSGLYYILYKIDAANAINEMRETNNNGYFRLYQDSPATLPYTNDFEVQIDGWRHNSSLGADDWQWTTPQGNLLNEAFSGTKVWITSDTGLVTDVSRMHLYTPIFNFTQLESPVIEFDMKLVSDGACECFNGKMNMSYSIDNGATWIIADTTNNSYNRWYYPMEHENGVDQNYYTHNHTKILFDVDEPAFATYDQYNSRDCTRNTRYILDLSFLSGNPFIQLRFNLATLKYYYETEGVIIDNFTIRDKFIDLAVPNTKAFMMSSESGNILIDMSIKNQGNYISHPSTVNYYLSANSQYDDSDYYLGQAAIPAVRPDLAHNVNLEFDVPSNLEEYNNLIYSLDVNESNQESYENNNIGLWPLALDSIESYPYFSDFSDSIINGWIQYSTNSLDDYRGRFRIRHRVAPGELLYASQVESDQYFTDPRSPWLIPTYYLRSPSYNFSGLDSIYMSFDLMCSGQSSSSNKDGGKLYYSITGGNSWTQLLNDQGPNTNWYDSDLILNNFGNTPGWYGMIDPNNVFTPTGYDISFLKGEKHVVFEFRYKSNHQFSTSSPQGFRLDNFSMVVDSLDYVALDYLVNINATAQSDQFDAAIHVQNIGPSFGETTAVNLYWSADDQLDDFDLLFQSFELDQVNPGNTVEINSSIVYPTPLLQSQYYLFVTIDGENDLIETNEINNLSSFLVTFDTTITVQNKDIELSMDLWGNEDQIIIAVNGQLYQPIFDLKLYNLEGQLVLTDNIHLNQGINSFDLPKDLASGTYLVKLHDKTRELSEKVLIVRD